MKNKAEYYLKEFGREEEASIPILQAIQKDYGYLPEALLIEICEKSAIKKNRLYGVATFYSQFKLKSAGKNIIKVCKGTACHVRGAEKILSAIQETLGIRSNEVTADGNFSLETVACLGCCSLAPAMMINDKVYGKLNATAVKKIIKEFK
ncbi:MAG: NADH-quinone oxidoreductase subunit NuoE [Candidatus Margulisbacteria bacterium]|nr:NADH-quinone oxidoreductase subunit NuoE [Candidatus Margulisiibacteriota bacterium]